MAVVDQLTVLLFSCSIYREVFLHLFEMSEHWVTSWHRNPKLEQVIKFHFRNPTICGKNQTAELRRGGV